jgi:hypothetical protein
MWSHAMRLLQCLLTGIALLGAAGAGAQPADPAGRPVRPLIIPDYNLGTMTSLAVLAGKCVPAFAGEARFACRAAVVLQHRKSEGGDATILACGEDIDHTLAVTGTLGSDDVLRVRYAFPKPGRQITASGTCRLRRGSRGAGVSINDDRSGEWTDITCSALDAGTGQPLFEFRFAAESAADVRRRQMAAYAAGTEKREVNYAPDSCATGTVPPYPEFGDGLVTHYGFQSETALDDPASLIQKLANDHVFATYAIDALDRTLLDTLPSKRVASPAQIDAQLRRLCAIVAPSGFQIASLLLRTVQQETNAQRARWMEAREIHRTFGGPRLKEADVGAILRAHWTERYRYEFGLADARFARVRENDLRCRYTEVADNPAEDHITCIVGVLATSARGPEYAQEEVEFTNGPNRDNRHEILLPYGAPLILGGAVRITKH